MSVMVIKDDYEEAVDVEIPITNKKKQELGNRDVAYALEKAGYKLKKGIFKRKEKDND